MCLKREKTSVALRLPPLSKAHAIIGKYRERPSNSGSDNLFPTISNQKLNSYLKEIADVCRIRKLLTFHVARHTFATTVTLGNGVPIETVSKLLGHKKISTTQIYARVLERKTGEDMRLLERKLEMESGAPQERTQ
ncbi:site-specific integrase [Neotamlana sedimentorum]|uniref:site-specific integrase n=1 Tax=Neotamlana sedimentorum TaxID=1435349 RepID=UPI001969C4CA